ncbi:MAG: 3-hydroxybutyryl-CoA dehydrogenase, partial [Melioribacteraceae bacterium]
MNKVAVIGGGTMGNGIAHVFAASGFRVSLVDVKQDFLDNALSTISKNLDRLVKKETITELDKINTLNNLTT